MGEAKKRGTFEKRKQAAIEREQKALAAHRENVPRRPSPSLAETYGADDDDGRAGGGYGADAGPLTLSYYAHPSIVHHRITWTKPARHIARIEGSKS